MVEVEGGIHKSKLCKIALDFGLRSVGGMEYTLLKCILSDGDEEARCVYVYGTFEMVPGWLN